jgi:hypothetical protein
VNEATEVFADHVKAQGMPALQRAKREEGGHVTDPRVNIRAARGGDDAPDAKLQPLNDSEGRTERARG